MNVTQAEPFRVRPRRVRVVAWIAAGAVVVFFTLIATALSSGEVFQAGDQAAMIGLGVVFAAGILTFTRPRVEADDTGVRIRNVIGGYDLPWGVIRAVRFDHGASWASLELADDDLVSVMAIQRVDRQHAVDAVHRLRRLLDAHAPAGTDHAAAGTDHAPAGTDDAAAGTDHAPAGTEPPERVG